MVFADAMTKAARLVELQCLFARSPHRRWTTRELAARLGIAERTVRVYLVELSASGKLPVVADRRGWRLVDGARIQLGPVSFQLEEAAAVYLAARLLLRHSDEPNPAVREAVRRLAVVVPEDLGRFMDRLVERAEGDATHPFAEVFRAMSYGWATRRWLEVEYQAVNRDTATRYRFAPYLLEPASREPSVYAIGLAEPPGALRVFKLERVRAAALTADTFDAPPHDDLLARLDQAWEVWLSDEGGTEVRLRFTAAAARAVSEARWHPSQRIERLPDGGVELRLVVSSTVELTPWILGWGAECEVLEPAALREQVASEHASAAARYAAGRSPRPPLSS
ncbi:MAG TPA: WYL domain-containing transcriptional regulator [Thermoanaerobaculaceae bacterium]|nr:WYL domain-containing transcriptional regulator [Thermoanaerobaculaceae bacterium]